MIAHLVVSIAMSAQAVQRANAPALPSHPCIAAATAGIWYEATSSEWSWSPSGGSIAYDRAVGDVSQLRVRDLAGSDETCITSGEFHDSQPSWSPDGSRIAFVRGAGAAARIHLLRLATGEALPLPASEQPSEYPRFSPDGSRLAYVRHAEGSERRRFVVVRDLATDAERVLFDSPFGLNNLCWTPDGSAVLLYSIDDDGWNDIYEAKADGSGVRRLTDNTVTDSYSASYSPDGTRLLFGQGSEVSPYHRWFNYDLYDSDVATGSVRRLTWAHNSDDRGDWSPDGRTIGFVTRRSGYAEIWLMDSDGSNLRPVTRQPEGELTSLIRRDGVAAGETHLERVRARRSDAMLMGDRAAAVLAHQYLARGDVDAAVRIARMGVAMHPGSWWTRTALGRTLLAAGATDAARAAFRESLSINPNQHQIAFDLGFTDFVTILDSIDGLYADRGREVFELVHWLHMRGELLSAITLLQRLDRAHPDDADVIGRLAYMQMALGDHESAIASYTRVLALDPDRDDARLHLRRLGGSAGPPTNPSRLSRDVLEPAPPGENQRTPDRSPDGLRIALLPSFASAEALALGTGRIDQGVSDEGLARPRANVEHCPEDVHDRVELGEACESHGDRDEAAAAFGRALSIDPDSLHARAHRERLGPARATTGQWR